MDAVNDRQINDTADLLDREIIDRVLRGEKNMYSVLMRRYNARLYRVGMSFINDDVEVEDVMQVTYIKAYENLAKFAFRSSFSTWLARILINECLLRLKKRKSFIVKTNEMMDSETYLTQAVDTQTPLVKTLNAELRTILEKAILALPEKYRTVFVMREIENMNVAETRDCLDISEVNVKVRLNRARNILKDLLNKQHKKEELLHYHLSRCDKMVEIVMSRMDRYVSNEKSDGPWRQKN